MQPSMRIIISAGADGAYGFSDGEWEFRPAPRVPVASSAGAGDALLAGVLCGLAAGLPLCSRVVSGSNIDSALALGVLLASFSVTSPDTIHAGASVRELQTFAASVGTSFGEEVRRVIVNL
jgi:sugar/nucleoside kinase (ribokinase family)